MQSSNDWDFAIFGRICNMPVGPYNTKSSDKCKRDLIQFVIHWSYVSSSLTHQNDVPYIPILELHRVMKVVVCDHMM